MSSITLSAATRQNLLSLQDTAALLSTTQSRLSTGKKVNSALDNPTNFFTSQSLTARSGDLAALLDGISNGIQTIQAANQGITSIQKLIDSAKSTAAQALADKSGSSGASSTASAGTTNVSAGTGTKTPATPASVTGGGAVQAQDFSTSGDASFTVSLDGGQTKQTITLNSQTFSGAKSVSAGQILGAITAQIQDNSALRGKLTATLDDTGALKLETVAKSATARLGVSYAAGSTTNIGFGSDSAARPNAIAASGTMQATLDLTGIASSVRGAAALAEKTDLSASGSKIQFEVRSSDGNFKTVLIDATTKVGGVGFAKAAEVTRSEIEGAINDQLKDTGRIAAFDAQGYLKISATTAGKVTNDVAIKANVSTVDVGFGIAAKDNAGTSTPGADGSASFTIKVGNGSPTTIKIDKDTVYDGATAKLGPSATRDNVVKAIQSQVAGLGLTVSLSDNKLQIASTNFGSDSPALTLTPAASIGGVDLGFGTVAASAIQGTGGAGGASIPAYKDATGTDEINSTPTPTPTPTPPSGGVTNTTRQALARQFNELLNQISQQAKDASYNGTNLLYRTGTDAIENTLQVAFNEKGDSKLSISGVKFDAAGLGLSSVTGDFQSDDEINAALTAIKSATNLLRTQSSTFGANLSVVQNRMDFSKALINILDTGSANLVNADMNEEAANSQALSTRNSLAISALSLANQAQQGILQLLR